MENKLVEFSLFRVCVCQIFKVYANKKDREI